MDASWFVALLGILCLDLTLSGDNAIVIASICNGLPKEQQRLGLIGGTVGAIILRVLGALIAGYLLIWPGVSIGIGLYLVWVAVQLVAGHDEGGEKKPATSLFNAMLAIAAADIGMSLDNVAAVAALAKGDDVLMAIGILLSIILMVCFAALIMRVIERFPAIKWFGSALLGWIAGGVMIHDPLLLALEHSPNAGLFASVIGSGVVLIVAVLVGFWQQRTVRV